MKAVNTDSASVGTSMTAPARVRIVEIMSVQPSLKKRAVAQPQRMTAGIHGARVSQIRQSNPYGLGWFPSEGEREHAG